VEALTLGLEETLHRHLGRDLVSGGGGREGEEEREGAGSEDERLHETLAGDEWRWRVRSMAQGFRANVYCRSLTDR
jgi:hypothetical protein